MRRTILLSGLTAFVMAIAGASLVIGLALPAIVSAQAAPGGALPTGNDEHFVGSYLSNVAVDGVTRLVYTNSFNADGTMTFSGFPFEPGDDLTGGHGVWERTADHTYAWTGYRILRDSAGNQSIQRVRSTITLNATNSGYTSRQAYEMLDASGNVVGAPVNATSQAIRIDDVPLP